MNFQIFLSTYLLPLYKGSDNVINTNQNKEYSNDPSEPDFEGFYFVVRSSDSGNSICQYPGEQDNGNTGCQCKNDGQIKP